MSAAAAGKFLSVRDTFRGRHVLITGSSGFLGKTLVEKILREVPDVGGLHLLIRPRKGFSVDERMRQEVVQSDIFMRLRTQLGAEGFEAMIKQKVHAVPGELTHEYCGMAPDMRDRLHNTIEIIMHVAAVVEFNERIDRAIDLNVMGAVRMLEFAKRCPKLIALLHTSTCYVNSNQPQGFIDERVHPLSFDPQEVIDKVRRMNVDEMSLVRDSGLLRDWPNTYTFTKAIAENMIVKNRGSVPLVILRPSIVGGAWRDPVPGWCDVVSAAGAVYVACGLGVLKFLPGNPNNVADIVPVDTVINAMLCAIPSIAGQDRYFVCHAATSTEKPLRWALPIAVVPRFFNEHPPTKRLSKAEFSFLRSPQNYQLQFFLRYSVPSSMLNVLAAVSPNKAHKERANQIERLVFKVRVLIDTFRHFVEQQWQFSNKNVRACWSVLSPEEKNIFNVDLTEMDWQTWTNNYCFGLMRYSLKENLVEVTDFQRKWGVNDWAGSAGPGGPVPQLLDYVAPDVSWALAQRESASAAAKARPSRSVAEMRELVLRAPSVQAAIRAASKASSGASAGKSAPKKPAQGGDAGPPAGSVAAFELEARQIFDRLAGEVSMDVVAGMGWALRKIWRRLYQNIQVDMEGLKAIRELAQRPGAGPLLFMPTHRSYLDFLVISYICFTQDLPIPCIAAGEDFLGIMLVRWLFRKSGAFFIRRSFSDDPLYTAIFSQYIEQLLVDGHSLEFFIEGTRSRSGKMLQPKTGMMSAVAATLLDRKVPELNVLPITINYERTMESNLYSNELLGERKIKESLANLLRSSPILNNKFGHITVRFAPPISMKQFAIGHLAHHHRLLANASASPADSASVSAASSLSAVSLSSGAPVSLAAYERSTDKDGALRRGFVRALSFRLSHDLNIHSECMPTHLVAALMLMYRQGITREELVTKVDWLRRETIARGGRVALAQSYDRTALVDIAVRHLGSALSVRRSGVLEANIGSRALYNNMLVLGQYRNKIVHLYFREAVLAVTLYAHLSGPLHNSGTGNGTTSASATAAGVPKALLLQDATFLASLLDREFIYKASPDDVESVDDWLVAAQERGILCVASDAEQRVTVAASGEAMYSFLCSLLWPFVDSYFAATMILFSLQPSKSVDGKLLLQRCQWLATTLYHEQMMCFYEACSNDTLQNALSRLHAWKVCTLVRPSGAKTESDKSKATFIQLLPPYQTEEKLNELVARIESFRKPAPVRRSVRGNLVADIPILAKL